MVLFDWHRQRVLCPKACLEFKSLLSLNASWACPEVFYFLIKEYYLLQLQERRSMQVFYRIPYQIIKGN